MIRRVESIDDQDLNKIFALYHDAFPPEYREPDEQILAEVAGRARLPLQLIVWDEDGFGGFARFVKLPQTGVGFLIHIAVVPEQRSRGIGLKLLQEVHQGVGGSNTALLAEVEEGPPMEWWTTRGGARLVTPAYTQPPVRAETGAMPLNLVARGDSFEKRDWPSVVRGFYREAWELKEEHPFVLQAVAGIRR